MQSISRIREILNAIVCPACYGQLALEETTAPAVICTACARRYPVEDGIPVLIESRATRLSAPDAPTAAS